VSPDSPVVERCTGVDRARKSGKVAGMGRLEKVFVLGAVIYMAVYVPIFFYITTAESMNGDLFALILPFHFTGMGLNLIALVLTIRDLYKRDFKSANDKVTWALLILMTGGIGWFVYVFKYALKPRLLAGGRQQGSAEGSAQ
jgi:hypothetical protein